MDSLGLHSVDRSHGDDFALGGVVVSPRTRQLARGSQRVTIEPKWMGVLVALAARPGQLVSRRELYELCWAGVPVGDDSLNRAIAGLRRVAAGIPGSGLKIATVRSAGYVLSVDAGAAGSTSAPIDRAHALEQADQSWRLDFPTIDHAAIAALEALVSGAPDDAELWGMLALLLRLAAENAAPAERGGFTRRCEAAAARALTLEPGSPVAETALISLPANYGDWNLRRARLAEVLACHADCAPALHEQAILEMATGRPSAAVPIIERLLSRYPVAPAFLYKRIYHLWTLGRIEEMLRLGDRAVDLWPGHLAIAMARLWSLGLSGRRAQAAAHLRETAAAGALPPPVVALHEAVLDALEEPARGGPRRRRAAAMLVDAAALGPVQANAAIVQLAGLGAVDEAFAVADGYYLQRGPVVVGLQRSPHEPMITDQSRRVTQLLFIPATASMRGDPRFEVLVEAIGLADHWRRVGIEPDYRATRAATAA
jgi:DNA-binding winged helix-turn-helix (wHTH) protein